MMQQCRELLLLVPACCFPHTSKSLGHALPSLCPVRVGLFGVPLGRTASLHDLRRELLPFVRSLRWYYLFVRFPDGVHAGLIAFRFLQPVRLTAAGHLRGLPVLAHGIFRHAWGLGLRGIHSWLTSIASHVIAFRLAERRRHPGREGFRSSIPCLPVPLSTLRSPPYDDFRMTRGQDGALFLSCRTLSFPIPCRFIPAHSA